MHATRGSKRERGPAGQSKEGRPDKGVEAGLDHLFALPLNQFTPARNALVVRLKKAGQAEDAERIRGLSRPPVSAWVVNQLYWNARDVLDAFLKESDRVRAAEQALLEGRKAAGHAELLTARAAALEQLMSRASTRAAEEGTPLSWASG